MKLPVQVKVEFEVGALVAINGKNLDEEHYSSSEDPPTFLGVVTDPNKLDWVHDVDTNPGETLVEWNIAGEFKWLDM